MHTPLPSCHLSLLIGLLVGLLVANRVVHGFSLQRNTVPNTRLSRQEMSIPEYNQDNAVANMINDPHVPNEELNVRLLTNNELIKRYQKNPHEYDGTLYDQLNDPMLLDQKLTVKDPQFSNEPQLSNQMLPFNSLNDELTNQQYGNRDAFLDDQQYKHQNMPDRELTFHRQIFPQLTDEQLQNRYRGEFLNDQQYKHQNIPDRESTFHRQIFPQLTDEQLPDMQLTDQQLSGTELADLELADNNQLTDEQINDQQLTFQHLSNQQLTDNQLTDRQLADQQLADLQLTDLLLTDQQLSNQQITDQQLSNQQIPDQQLTDQQLSKQQLTDQQLTDQQLTDQQLSDQQLSNQQLSNQQLSCERLTVQADQDLTDQQLSNQQLSNQQLSCERLTEQADQDLTDQQLTDEQLTQEQLHDQQLTQQAQESANQEQTDQQLSDQQLHDQQLSDQQFTDQQLSDQQLTDQQQTDQQLSDQQLNEQQQIDGEMAAGQFEKRNNIEDANLSPLTNRELSNTVSFDRQPMGNNGNSDNLDDETNFYGSKSGNNRDSHARKVVPIKRAQKHKTNYAQQAKEDGEKSNNADDKADYEQTKSRKTDSKNDDKYTARGELKSAGGGKEYLNEKARFGESQADDDQRGNEFDDLKNENYDSADDSEGPRVDEPDRKNGLGDTSLIDKSEEYDEVATRSQDARADRPETEDAEEDGSNDSYADRLDLNEPPDGDVEAQQKLLNDRGDDRSEPLRGTAERDSPQLDTSRDRRGDEEIDGGERAKRELEEKDFKNLYIQKLADDIKQELERSDMKNIPVERLSAIVKRELERNFKNQYVAKLNEIVKKELEEDLKSLDPRQEDQNSLDLPAPKVKREALARVTEMRNGHITTSEMDLQPKQITKVSQYLKREIVKALPDSIESQTRGVIGDYVAQFFQEYLNSMASAEPNANFQGNRQDDRFGHGGGKQSFLIVKNNLSRNSKYKQGHLRRNPHDNDNCKSSTVQEKSRPITENPDKTTVQERCRPITENPDKTTVQERYRPITENPDKTKDEDCKFTTERSSSPTTTQRERCRPVTEESRYTTERCKTTAEDDRKYTTEKCRTTAQDERKYTTERCRTTALDDRKYTTERCRTTAEDDRKYNMTEICRTTAQDDRKSTSVRCRSPKAVTKCCPTTEKTDTEKCDSTTERCEPTTSSPKSTTCSPTSTTCRPKSTTCRPKSTTCRPKSTACRPKSTTCRPRPTTCRSTTCRPTMKKYTPTTTKCTVTEKKCRPTPKRCRKPTTKRCRPPTTKRCRPPTTKRCRPPTTKRCRPPTTKRCRPPQTTRRCRPTTQKCTCKPECMKEKCKTECTTEKGKAECTAERCRPSTTKCAPPKTTSRPTTTTKGSTKRPECQDNGEENENEEDGGSSVGISINGVSEREYFLLTPANKTPSKHSGADNGDNPYIDRSQASKSVGSGKKQDLEKGKRDPDETAEVASQAEETDSRWPMKAPSAVFDSGGKETDSRWPMRAPTAAFDSGGKEAGGDYVQIELFNVNLESAPEAAKRRGRHSKKARRVVNEDETSEDEATGVESVGDEKSELHAKSYIEGADNGLAGEDARVIDHDLQSENDQFYHHVKKHRCIKPEEDRNNVQFKSADRDSNFRHPQSGHHIAGFTKSADSKKSNIHLTRGDIEDQFCDNHHFDKSEDRGHNSLQPKRAQIDQQLNQDTAWSTGNSQEVQYLKNKGEPRKKAYRLVDEHYSSDDTNSLDRDGTFAHQRKSTGQQLSKQQHQRQCCQHTKEHPAAENDDNGVPLQSKRPYRENGHVGRSERASGRRHHRGGEQSNVERERRPLGTRRLLWLAEPSAPQVVTQERQAATEAEADNAAADDERGESCGDQLRNALFVDWEKAVEPHAAIRKRDLSTDPLNGFDAGENTVAKPLDMCERRGERPERYVLAEKDSAGVLKMMHGGNGDVSVSEEDGGAARGGMETDDGSESLEMNDLRSLGGPNMDTETLMQILSQMDLSQAALNRYASKPAMMKGKPLGDKQEAESTRSARDISTSFPTGSQGIIFSKPLVVSDDSEGTGSLNENLGSDEGTEKLENTRGLKGGPYVMNSFWENILEKGTTDDVANKQQMIDKDGDTAVDENMKNSGNDLDTGNENYKKDGVQESNVQENDLDTGFKGEDEIKDSKETKFFNKNENAQEKYTSDNNQDVVVLNIKNMKASERKYVKKYNNINRNPMQKAGKTYVKGERAEQQRDLSEDLLNSFGGTESYNPAEKNGNVKKALNPDSIEYTDDDDQETPTEDRVEKRSIDDPSELDVRRAADGYRDWSDVGLDYYAGGGGRLTRPRRQPLYAYERSDGIGRRGSAGGVGALTRRRRQEDYEQEDDDDARADGDDYEDVEDGYGRYPGDRLRLARQADECDTDYSSDDGVTRCNAALVTVLCVCVAVYFAANLV